MLELNEARRRLEALRNLCVAARADVMHLGYVMVEDVEALVDGPLLPLAPTPEKH